MATTPITPQTPQPDWVQQHIESLHKHQVTISYFFVTIIVGLVLCMGVGGLLGIRSYEKLLDRAEAQEEKYDADRKSFYDTLAQHDADRANNDAKQAQLVAGIAARAKEAPAPVVQTGLKADASVVEAKNALQAVYSDTPTLGSLEATSEGKVGATVSQAQIFIGSKLSLDHLKLDFGDVQKVLELEKQTNSSLVSDLAQCKATNVEADKTIADYKKAAVKSKWAKLWDGTKKGLIFAVGIGIGRAVH
jgi:hypothetical protein